MGLVVDFFAHSGTTLLAAEINRRRCFTADLDPVFCEISIRRLEHFRKTRRLGWQNSHAFVSEISLPEILEAPDKDLGKNENKLQPSFL
jgi:site-specific DNA-methyltransferase (adenine-specific)